MTDTHLEPLTPQDGLGIYLDQRRDELSEATLRSHEYRLGYFVQWCEEVGLDNLNDLSGRDLFEYRNWRKTAGETELKPVSLKTQLRTLRVFLKLMEQINAVTQGLHDRIPMPYVGDGDVSDITLSEEEADALLDYLGTYHYASKKHALFATAWVTSARLGALRALDVSDFHPEDQALHFEHRPERGTPLKNSNGGERYAAIPSWLVDVLQDYIDEHRPAIEDEHGRKPLFPSKQGRPVKNRIRRLFYSMTRPCWYGQECPDGRDPNECEVNNYRHASKCPGSVSSHPVRRGSISALLRDGTPKHVVSDRCDVSASVLDKHYDARDEREKMQLRREFLGFDDDNG